MPIESLAGPLVLAAIFLGGGAVHAASPRVALSVGAGVSTAYVFVYMLPELSEASAAFVSSASLQDGDKPTGDLEEKSSRSRSFP